MLVPPSHSLNTKSEQRRQWRKQRRMELLRIRHDLISRLNAVDRALGSFNPPEKQTKRQKVQPAYIIKQVEDLPTEAILTANNYSAKNQISTRSFYVMPMLQWHHLHTTCHQVNPELNSRHKKHKASTKIRAIKSHESNQTETRRPSTDHPRRI